MKKSYIGWILLSLSLSAFGWEYTNLAPQGTYSDARAHIDASFNSISNTLATEITNGIGDVEFGGMVTGLYNNLTIETNVVTGSMVVDGTLSNADIAASAAIDGSKLAMKSATQWITTNGYADVKQINGTNMFVYIVGLITNVLDTDINQ